jgi:hypothetical protein
MILEDVLIDFLLKKKSSLLHIVRNGVNFGKSEKKVYFY